ncbi:MAG: Rpn family recombination-promoting nuclease/putative transposase [Lachnospiraceae bacterium]|nr:Rpn family recombination-promoting nuclease/putative transposase [Lachnospiraceae bacterium]
MDARKARTMMGKQDTSTKDYISDGDIFADAVNYYLYGGERVIDPGSLRPLDSALLLHIFREDDEIREASSSGEKNREISEPVQRYRDVVRQASMMTDDHCAYVIIGLEAQTMTHYAMAVKSIVYDGLQYARQVELLRMKHRLDGDKGSSEEFLSGMHKEDRLIPVITICLHFGTEAWDGALSLMELFDLPDERLLPYIQDYKVFLIEPARMSDEDFDKFSTSLGLVLRFLKAGQDKRKLAELVNGDDAFKSLDRKAARVIRDCANVDIQIREEEEVVNVCKGWYDAIEDAREEEREAAREREKELCKGWYDAIEDARIEEREAAREREKELCKGWYDAIEDAREEVRKEEREAAQEREIHSVLDAYRKFNIPEVEIRQWIVRKYSLSEDDIDRYMLAANA